MRYHSVQKVIFLLILSCLTVEGVTSRQLTVLTKPIKSNRFPFKDADTKASVRLILYNNTEASSYTNDSYTPVLLWHGMGDTAYGSINIDRLAIQRLLRGISVFSVQVGNNELEDELGGYFVNANYQVEEICRQVLNNSIIRKHGSLNCVGYSQGSQFLRALIQRCPFQEYNIKVKNFISLGGQHQGVFGLPRCHQKLFCDYIRHVLTYAAYEPDVQEHIVQAEYWHDSFKEEEYKRKNIFLADINNELHVNETYRRRLSQLDNMVLVKFLNDSMVTPIESSLFGFYKPNSKTEILPLVESSIYLEDRLGLKELNENNRLHLKEVVGDHLQYTMSWFINDVVEPFLRN